MHCLILLKFVC